MQTFRKTGSDQEIGLLELIEKIPVKGVMVELGSAYGESALIFAKSFDSVHCVDVWANSTEEREKDFDKATSNSKNIYKHKGDTMSALDLFEDNSLDFVYIDANHSYPYVFGDINMWRKKIKKGGAIGGHDYSFKFVGTIQAVEETLGHPDYVFRDSSWIKILK